MSIASLPEPVKNTCLNCGGVSSASLAASSMAGGGRALEEAVVVGQLVHLPVRGVGQLAPAVAQSHAPQTRHAIEHAAAVGVVQVDALGARDQPRAPGGDLPGIGERMQEMRCIERLPVRCAAPLSITRSTAGAHAPRN